MFDVWGSLETVHYNSSTIRTDRLLFVKFSVSTYIGSPEMSCKHNTDILYCLLGWYGKLVRKLLLIYTYHIYGATLTFIRVCCLALILVSTNF